VNGPDPFAAVPSIDDRRIAVRITKDALRHIRRGHPWIFDESIVSESFGGRAGDLAVVFNDDRKFVAIGLYDPDSPIRIRVLHRGKPTTVNVEFWRSKLAEAAEARAILTSSADTTGFRLVNGENDSLPGLVIDMYDGTAVIKLYSAAWFGHLAEVVEALGDHAQSVVLRLARQVSKGDTFGLSDGQVLVGPLNDPVLFLENGLTFEAHTLSGQKTGHFLDQRENRQQVRQMSAGKRVLDVFSCTGGFSVYAAAGGATEVHSVDLSPQAIEAAVRNFEHNHDATVSCLHRTTVGDAFEVMADMAKAKERYDIVVVDPPSFAQRAADSDRAIRAYKRLTHLAVRLVKPGGQLVQASCSSRVSAAAFFEAVANAANDANVTLSDTGHTSHAVDHPIGFPEGAYLKALFATVG
jgi:23S rRNA (cytosine1962-C5)-methyltransferase